MDFHPTAATSSPATAGHFNSLHTPTPPSTRPTTTTKSLSFTNGALKRRHTSPPHTAAPAPVTYKECLKNHAAAIGGHALDGCGEFMPSSAATPTDPRSLKCAACGCHRNFHRREPHHQELPSSPTFLSCFYPPLPPPPPPLAPRGLSPSPSSSPSPGPSSPSPLSSPSPPVMSHFPPPNYHTSAPPFLVALGSAYSGPSDGRNYDHHRRVMNSPVMMKRTKEKESSSGTKRHRTKFSQEQKKKMFEFSEKLGWRMQKENDKEIEDFCNEIGVTRGVFKVWMHNNKNTYGKKSENVGNNVQIEKMNNEGGHDDDDDANNEDDHRSGDDDEEGGSRINLQFSVN